MKKYKSIIISIGLCLLLFLFLFNRSFYLDEASLAINFIDCSYSDLLKPFPNNQIAPVLFLIFSKFLVSLLGYKDIVFRILPFLFSCGFVLLIYPTLFLLGKDKKVAFYTSLLLITSPILLRYGTEFKQYSCDLFSGIFLVYLFLKFSGIKRNFLLAVVGSLFIFWSNITIIILGTIGPFLLFKEMKKTRIPSYHLLLTITSWGVAFSIYYLNFIANNTSREFMESFWSYAFLPANPFNISFWKWLIQRFGVVYYKFYYYNIFFSNQYKYIFLFLPYFILFLKLFGIKHLWNKKALKVLYICICPLIIHLSLSAFHLYPFSARNSLYLLPFISLLLIFGIKAILSSLEKKKNIRLVLISLIVIPFFLNTIINFPFKNQEVKTGLQFIKENFMVTQRVYIFKDINTVVKFYQHSQPLLREDQIIYGVGNIIDQVNIRKDIQALEEEVWFLFANENPIESRKSIFHLNKEIFSGEFYKKTDIDLFLEEINKEGGVLLKRYEAVGCSVFLFSFKTQI